MSIPRWLQILALVLVVAGYPVLMHLLLTSSGWPALTLLMAVLPFAMLPASLLAAGRTGLGLLSVAAMAAAVASAWRLLLHSPDWIYLLQNVGMQTMLAGGFGHTLLPGQEPLISRLARRLHGVEYTAEIAAYTRQVTWAWTLYFVAMAVTSVVLFVSAPLPVWSWFVNFLSFALLGLMFTGEYAVRRWRLRGVRHVSLLQSVKLYWQQPPASGYEPSRH